MKVYAGKFKKIYDPSVGEALPWYVNDHTIIKGGDGWHLFGITHAEPAEPPAETLCAHAVSKDPLTAPFRKLPYPLQAQKEYGELHFWAPHVIAHNDAYYMFYCAGDPDRHDRYRIHLAVSEDLYQWERHPENPMLVDGFDARDPMVLHVGDEWIMYYTCTLSPQGGSHCVACVFSRDLIHWHGKRVVFTSPLSGTYGGPCESPFVEKGGRYLLSFYRPVRRLWRRVCRYRRIRERRSSAFLCRQPGREDPCARRGGRDRRRKTVYHALRLGTGRRIYGAAVL